MTNVSEIYHIAVSSDDNYLPHAAVMLNSLFKNNFDRNFFIHFLDGGFSTINRNKIVAFLNKKGVSHKFYTVDNSSIIKAPVNNYITLAAYNRIFLADVLPKDIDRVLYLDCDLVIMKSIEQIYNIDFEEYYLAAIREIIGDSDRKRIHFTNQDNYFNSGVMLINLKRWREEEIRVKLVQFIENYPERILYWDQDVLNCCMVGKWKELSAYWNVTHFYFYPEKFAPEYFGLLKEEYENLKKTPSILHFTSGKKPWLFNSDHPFKSEYFKYLKGTPWEIQILGTKRYFVSRIKNFFND